MLTFTRSSLKLLSVGSHNLGFRKNLFIAFFFFSSHVAVNGFLVILFVIATICMKKRSHSVDVEVGGNVLSDGIDAVDFNACEVNEDDNDDSCPASSNSFSNENYVGNKILDC